MKPENHVKIAPQRNQKRVFGIRFGTTLPLVAASSSFWNWHVDQVEEVEHPDPGDAREEVDPAQQELKVGREVLGPPEHRVLLSKSKRRDLLTGRRGCRRIHGPDAKTMTSEARGTGFRFAAVLAVAVLGAACAKRPAPAKAAAATPAPGREPSPTAASPARAADAGYDFTPGEKAAVDEFLRAQPGPSRRGRRRSPPLGRRRHGGTLRRVSPLLRARRRQRRRHPRLRDRVRPPRLGPRHAVVFGRGVLRQARRPLRARAGFSRRTSRSRTATFRSTATPSSSRPTYPRTSRAVIAGTRPAVATSSSATTPRSPSSPPPAQI